MAPVLQCTALFPCNRFPWNSLCHALNFTNKLELDTVIKQLLDEAEHDIMNYQNRGLCYLPKPKAEADNTDTRF